MIYSCEECCYITKIKSHFSRHLNTKKHIKNTKELCSHNSDENTTSYKFCESDQKVTPNDPKMTPKYTFFCEFCEIKFSTKAHLKRHHNNSCKKINGVKKIKLFNKIIESKISAESADLLINNIDKLKNNDINSISTMNNYNTINNTLNNNSNNNITININNYGDENLEILNDNNLKKYILEMPFTAIPKMIEQIHFNNQYPENKNIKLKNKKDNKLLVLQDKKWNYVNKMETIKNLIEDKSIDINNLYRKNQHKLTDKFKERYLKFQKKFDQEDLLLWKDILMQTELVFWNNME